MEKEYSKNRIFNAILVILIIVLIVLTVYSMVLLRHQVSSYETLTNDKLQDYDGIYVLITGENDPNMWDSVYLKMKEYAGQSNIYVDRLGSNLSVKYSKSDLIRIAIDSKVDGIILEPDSSQETIDLISEADAAGIPVVTVSKDAPSAPHKSFIGISNYNLGNEYGTLITDASLDVIRKRTKEGDGLDTEVEVLVLMDSDDEDLSQNILYNAISEAVEKESHDDYKISISTAVVASENEFTAEESIRDILKNSDELPDVIVCLDDINTRNVYQTILNFNEVGDTTIIGYYDSETILKAIERNAVQIFFMPMFSPFTERMERAEALARIFDENVGFIPPNEFIAEAERNGSIIALGRQIFEKTCEFIKEQEPYRYGVERISVNLSAKQLMQEGMADEFIDIADRNGVSMESISFDIAEVSDIDSTGMVQKNMDRLISRGGEFALNDYGSGYSSLENIMKLPIDLVKIDRTLVRSYFESGSMLLPDVIEMFRNQKLKIALVGVETKDMARRLSVMGCDYLEGYFYSRTIPARNFVAMMKKQGMTDGGVHKLSG